jgi:hypothetical protein
MIPARAIQTVPLTRAIAVLARVPNFASAFAGTPWAPSPFNPFPVTLQTLIGSPQECERALSVLRQIRLGVIWWARVIQKQTPSPRASAWVLWYEELVATPSMDTATAGLLRRRSEKRWILTVGHVLGLMDGLHRLDVPEQHLLRQR